MLKFKKKGVTLFSILLFSSTGSTQAVGVVHCEKGWSKEENKMSIKEKQLYKESEKERPETTRREIGEEETGM